MPRRWRVTMGEFATQAVGRDLLRLLEHEPAASRFEPSGIHKMRTSTRRLRSNLRFFRRLLLHDESTAARTELKWLADRLGAVRDLDVLEDHLRVDLERDGSTCGPGVGPLRERLDSQRTQARAELSDALASTRYRDLRARLFDLARTPGEHPSAGRPAASRLPAMLDRRWARFLDHLSRLGADSPDETLHDLRKDAKRVRYAAEAAELASSESVRSHAQTIARQSTKFQEILGDLQDSVVEAAFLRDRLASAGPHASQIRRLLLSHAERQLHSRRRFESLRRETAADFPASLGADDHPGRQPSGAGKRGLAPRVPERCPPSSSGVSPEPSGAGKRGLAPRVRERCLSPFPGAATDRPPAPLPEPSEPLPDPEAHPEAGRA